MLPLVATSGKTTDVDLDAKGRGGAPRRGAWKSAVGDPLGEMQKILD